MDFNQLQEKYTEISQRLQIIAAEKQKKINAIDLEYEPQENLLKSEFKAMTLSFFDDVLVDRYGKKVNPGNHIIDEKNNIYEVKDRAMECIFGQLINNPHLEVLKLKKNLVPGKTMLTIGRSELNTDFKIIEIEQQRNHLKD